MATATTQLAGIDYEFIDPQDARQLLENYSTTAHSLRDSPGAVPHPGLNGMRVTLRPEERKDEQDNKIFFVWDGGVKCWIPDGQTYNNLFANLDGVIALSRKELDSISKGPDLTVGAMTVQLQGDGLHDPQYVLTNNAKHWIASSSVLRYCNFRTGTEMPRIIIDFIPSGSNIDYGA